jgi:hypothetical protein
MVFFDGHGVSSYRALRIVPPNSYIKCYEDLLLYYITVRYIVNTETTYFNSHQTRDSDIEETLFWAIARIKELHLYPRKRTPPPNILNRIWNWLGF